MCDGRDDNGSVNVLADDYFIEHDPKGLKFDLIIEHDVEKALQQSDALLDAVCPPIKEENESNSNNIKREDCDDIDSDDDIDIEPDEPQKRVRKRKNVPLAEPSAKRRKIECSDLTVKSESNKSMPAHVPIASNESTTSNNSNQKYPVFLSHQNGEMSCVFVHSDRPLSSELALSSFNEKQHCITAPPKLNGPSLN